MSALIRVPADSRQPYTHQAYDITYGGKSKETGADGPTSRLSATYQANFQISIPVDEVKSFSFILPSFVYSNSYLVVEGSGGSPAASMSVENIDGTGVKTLAAALDLSTTSSVDTAYDTSGTIDVEPNDQRVVVNITGAGTGYATILLKCDIVATAWK